MYDELDGQRGFPTVLIFLFRYGGTNIGNICSRTKISQTAFYNIMPKLKDLGLISEKYEVHERSRGKARKNYYLTEKGEKVADLLVEVEDVILNI